MKERLAMDDSGEWLLFVPQISVASGKLRAMLGRRLQGIGALQFQANLWLLPYSDTHERVIARMLAELEKQGGGGFFFRSQIGRDEMQQTLISQFQSIQYKEYSTFINLCQEFLALIEQQALNDSWSFDLLEENERSLQKLSNRLTSLQQRDFFPSAQSATAKAIHARCSQALYEFALSVYTYHNASAISEQTNGSEKSNGDRAQ